MTTTTKGAPPLDRQSARKLLAQMVLIRRFEERCVELYGQGKIRGFMHLYDGEEAIAVGLSHHMRDGDGVVATYREHGQALARGVPAGALMAEMFGKREGCSRGRGGSMHIFDKAHAFYGGNAIVAGGLPVAVGLALADQQLKRDRVTVCFFGEGAVAEGEFHEALNLAALWRVPIVFVCENNLYAMGSALHVDEADTQIAHKARNYAMAAEAVDGMDLLAVLDASKRALDIARKGAPVFLEMRTYRFRAHSMFDAQGYRTKEEVEQWKKKDPIPSFLANMKDAGTLTETDLSDAERDALRVIEDAVAFAEAGTFEPVSDLLKDVVAGGFEGARR
jgi:pyruvate dehydrogenase E1 component alpha subunit